MEIFEEKNEEFFDLQFHKNVGIMKLFVEQNLENINIHTQGYLNLYDNIMYKNLNLLNNNSTNKGNSTKFEKNSFPKITEKGLSLTLSFMNDKLLSLNKTRSRSPPFEIINSPDFRQILNAWSDLIVPAERQLSEELERSIVTQVEDREFYKMALFIIYLLLLVVLYLTVWIPSYGRVTGDYN